MTNWFKNKYYWLYVLVVVVGVYYFFLNNRIHTVRSVSSHFEYDSDNSQTSLVIYRSGDSGHVDDVLCMFPPDTKFSYRLRNGESLPVIKKVRLGGALEEFIGQTGYSCDLIE